MSDALKPFEKLNEAIPPFAKQLKSMLRRGVPQSSGTLINSISSYTSKRDGIVDRIAVRFKRYGVFLERGAGKGMGGEKGGKWLNEKTKKIMSTKASSLGKMGTGNRFERPWFNPVIKYQHEKLAELVAETVADGSISSLKYWLLKGTE